jgi:hypothetical protein
MLKTIIQQGRSELRTEAYPLGYVEGLNDVRTPLGDVFSILQLDVWDLPVNRRYPRISQVLVDAREAPASEKLPG